MYRPEEQLIRPVYYGSTLIALVKDDPVDIQRNEKKTTLITFSS
jgi:hypothetical protein